MWTRFVVGTLISAILTMLIIWGLRKSNIPVFSNIAKEV